MNKRIHAVFEGGVFKPTEPVDLPDHSEVEFEIRIVAAARKPYRSEVPRLWETLIARGELIEPTSSEIDQAWEAYLRMEADRAGIIDHVSFIVMRRLGVTQAFTNDKHFEAAGFEVLF